MRGRVTFGAREGRRQRGDRIARENHASPTREGSTEGIIDSR